MVLTVSFVLSPVTGLVCHRRQRIKVLSKPGRADFTSANLTPASGRQDHTILPSAASISRQRAVDRSQVFRLALRSHRAQNAAPSTASRPAFATIAIRPLCPESLAGERAVGWLVGNRPLLELSPQRPKATEPVQERGTAPVSSSTRTVALVGWDAKSSRCDLGGAKTEIFLQMGLDS